MGFFDWLGEGASSGSGLSDGHWHRPVEHYRISSGFGGWRAPSRKGESGHHHAGYDLAVPIGTTVRAGHSGTVTIAGPYGKYGNLVAINNGDGTETYYGHLSRIETHVGAGVQGGEEIAKSGSTGRSSGPHLHYEVRRNGVAVDPSFALNGAEGGVPSTVRAYAPVHNRHHEAPALAAARRMASRGRGVEASEDEAPASEQPTQYRSPPTDRRKRHGRHGYRRDIPHDAVTRAPESGGFFGLFGGGSEAPTASQHAQHHSGGGSRSGRAARTHGSGTHAPKSNNGKSNDGFGFGLGF